MSPRAFFSSLGRISSLLRTKGLLYTCRYLHFYLFWLRRDRWTARLLTRLAPYPRYLEVEVTTRCNLRCAICEHTYWKEPERDMSFEEFKGIVDQFPGLKWIGLTGIGESFLNRDFLKMLRYVKSRGVIVELYDTFYFIDEKAAGRLVEMGVDKILASVDAVTRETYERLRVGSSFDRVIRNVKGLLRIKREAGAHFPEIAFHFIVNRMNCHEIPRYIELVASLSETESLPIQFSQMLHEFPEIRPLFMKLPRELIQEAEETARRLGVPVTWNLDVPARKPPLSRCIEWTMPFVFVSGHVIPCCSGNEAGQRPFQKETAMGNVFQEPFRKIWSGERYKTLRRDLLQGRVPPPCRNCTLYCVRE